jgi:hypothetical protein
MRKSIAAIIGIAIACSFLAVYAGTPAAPPTTPTPITLPAKSFVGAITKINTKLSSITVKNPKATNTFYTTPQTIIKIKGVKKAFKDLLVNMQVLVTYEVKINKNMALTITCPPPQPPPPPANP